MNYQINKVVHGKESGSWFFLLFSKAVEYALSNRCHVNLFERVQNWWSFSCSPSKAISCTSRGIQTKFIAEGKWIISNVICTIKNISKSQLATKLNYDRLHCHISVRCEFQKLLNVFNTEQSGSNGRKWKI